MSNNSKCLLCGHTKAEETTLNLNEAFITAYMMNKLSEPFDKSEAFRLGIIDAEGRQLKKPETLNEKLAYTSIDSYITKIKRLLGNRSDLLNHSVYLEKVTDLSRLPIDLYAKELQFKAELSIIAKRFKDCLTEAKLDRLPTELIEKIVLESFS